MSPPLAAERRPPGADRGAPRRHDRLRRDRPRAARARGEGGAVRGRRERHDRARDRVPRALPRPRRARLLDLATLVTRMTAGPARASGCRAPRIAVGEPANLALWDLDERYVVGESGPALAQPQHRLPRVARCSGRCRLTARGRPGRASARPRWPRDGREPCYLADGIGLAGDDRRRRGVRRRRGRLHDGHDRLPGVAHRPELLRAAALLHRADDRQLRRRGRAPRSRRARRCARCSATRRATRRRRAGAACSTGCASRASSCSPRSTPGARRHLRDRGAMLAVAVGDGRSEAEARALLAGRAADDGPLARRRASPA